MWLLSAIVFVLPFIKELNFDNYLSDQDDSKNYTFINNKTKSQIINERASFHDFSKTSTTYRLGVRGFILCYAYTHICINICMHIYMYIR